MREYLEIVRDWAENGTMTKELRAALLWVVNEFDRLADRVEELEGAEYRTTRSKVLEAAAAVADRFHEPVVADQIRALEEKL